MRTSKDLLVEIVNDFVNNDKITVNDIISGKEGFEKSKILFFNGEINNYECKEWEDQWTEDQKKQCYLIIYLRKKIKNSVFGFKLLIGEDKNLSVLGEEREREIRNMPISITYS